jgi:hypothetical protein
MDFILRAKILIDAGKLSERTPEKSNPNENYNKAWEV